MALDKRYDRSVSSLSPLFRRGDPPDLRGPMCVATINILRASSFVRLSVVSYRSYSTGPNIVSMCVAGPGASHRREAISLSPAPTLAKTPLEGATANFSPNSTRRGKESPSYAMLKF